ncbi:MAG: PEGA domain-containing protein [Proteobacteria bacterium]|nr:PEGA domain-containing protein [Pseudomonadota bacterium]
MIPSLAVTPARDLGEATARSAPRTRRHWPALLAALVLGGATAAAAWIWRGESRETSHVPTFEGATPGRERQPSKPPAAGVPRTATPELPVARPSIATNPVVTGAATRAAQPPPTGRLPAEAERQRGQRGEDTARGRRAARRELRVARSSAVPEPSDRGWLRVGGLKLAGARVLIDGRPSGYAPFEQELPAGEHRLVVLDAESGRPLVDQTVLINGFHTRSNPQRVLR